MCVKVCVCLSGCTRMCVCESLRIRSCEWVWECFCSKAAEQTLMRATNAGVVLGSVAMVVVPKWSQDEKIFTWKLPGEKIKSDFLVYLSCSKLGLKILSSQYYSSEVAISCDKIMQRSWPATTSPRLTEMSRKFSGNITFLIWCIM